MKTRKIIAAVIILLAGIFAACEREYEVYNADLSAVSFDQKGADSLVYSFALIPEANKDTVDIPVKILGFTSSGDRVVNVQTVPEWTTAQEGVHYDKLPCIVKSDSVSGILQVVLHKTDDLAQKEVLIALRIADSEDFVAGPINERNFKIRITNQLIKPNDWLTFFGDYSVVKHKFIIEVTGKGTNYTEWKNSAMKLIYYMGILNKALYEYNSTHPGQPLTDEYGVPVTFPML